MRTVHLVIVASIALIPSLAAAQDTLPTAGEATGEANANQAAAPVREMSFGDGEDVRANILKPNDGTVTGEIHGTTKSLINVRMNFVPELLESTDDV